MLLVYFWRQKFSSRDSRGNQIHAFAIDYGKFMLELNIYLENVCYFLIIPQ